MLGVENVEYLGITPKNNKLLVALSKSKAVETWETSKFKRNVQSFLGMIKSLRRLIRDCAKIAKPLTTLTKTHHPNGGRKNSCCSSHTRIPHHSICSSRLLILKHTHTSPQMRQNMPWRRVGTILSGKTTPHRIFAQDVECRGPELCST